MAKQLRLDPIRCDGYGMCAELLPELIVLDDWGYPVISSAPVPSALLEHARRAADVCPVLALRLRDLGPAAAERPRGGGARGGALAGVTESQGRQRTLDT